tara:strand:- start:42 stop:419 length:378 start_codon:yes stop_codon:yes gene_type:complete
MKILIANEQATTADIGDTAHDVAAYPVDKFLGMTNDATSGTDLVLYFAGSAEGTGDGDASSVDKMTLTITANKHVDVMKAIADKISEPDGKNNGAIVVFDAERSSNKSDISDHITGVTVAVSAAD